MRPEEIEAIGKVIRHAFSDLVAYYISHGKAFMAFKEAFSTVAEECNKAKDEIIEMVAERPKNEKSE